MYLSGLAEIGGGAGVLADRTARPAGLVVDRDVLPMFVATNMADEAERFRAIPSRCCGRACRAGGDRLLDLARGGARYFGRQTAMMSRIEMIPATSPPSTTTR